MLDAIGACRCLSLLRLGATRLAVVYRRERLGGRIYTIYRCCGLAPINLNNSLSDTLRGTCPQLLAASCFSTFCWPTDNELQLPGQLAFGCPMGVGS